MYLYTFMASLREYIKMLAFLADMSDKRSGRTAEPYTYRFRKPRKRQLLATNLSGSTNKKQQTQGLSLP